ncbi:hypothetical protein HDU82_007185 [Entophlyctis luteolus]|nr:hypothetical protein HDU82_007185 [Entophlyctis luteolus]
MATAALDAFIELDRVRRAVDARILPLVSRAAASSSAGTTVTMAAANIAKALASLTPLERALLSYTQDVCAVKGSSARCQRLTQRLNGAPPRTWLVAVSNLQKVANRILDCAKALLNAIEGFLLVHFDSKSQYCNPKEMQDIITMLNMAETITCAIDTLEAILADSCETQKSFAGANGLETIATIITSHKSPHETKLKCIELLSLYLEPIPNACTSQQDENRLAVSNLLGKAFTESLIGISQRVLATPTRALHYSDTDCSITPAVADSAVPHEGDAAAKKKVVIGCGPRVPRRKFE